MNHLLNQPPTREATAHRERRSWRSHGRLLAAVAAGTALAGGVAGYVITAGDVPTALRPPPRRDARPPATPPPVLPAVRHCAGDPGREDPRHAAERLAKATVAEPSPGQWIYYKTIDYSALSGGQPGAVSTDEEWITFDGSGSAYYQDGQLLTHTSPAASPGVGVNPWAAWGMTATPKTAYDVLAALPVRPQALLSVIAAKSAGHERGDLVGALPVSGGAPTTEAQREFDFLA